MIKRGTAWAVLAATLMFSGAALWARPPFYYHKADVDRATFAAEYLECNELAGGVRAPSYIVISNNMYAMAAGALFAGFFGSREKNAQTENVLRTCMADKGYRRVEASDGEMKGLRRLEEKERVDRLFALAASSQPLGKLLPK